MARGVLACLATLTLTAPPVSAQIVGDYFYVSTPGSYRVGFLPPLAVVAHGSGLTYVNADVEGLHDVIAFGHYAPVQCPDEPGMCPEETPPWCLPPNPAEPWNHNQNFLPYLPGQCPLFWSELIPLGDMTPVLGLENTTPGETYTFYCTIHPHMRGTLLILPE